MDGALFGRGVVRLRIGQRAEGRQDIAAALAREPGVEARYARAGMRR